MLLVHTTGMMNVGIDLSDVIKVTAITLNIIKQDFAEIVPMRNALSNRD
jgi:hypothetical protein